MYLKKCIYLISMTRYFQTVIFIKQKHTNKKLDCPNHMNKFSILRSDGLTLWPIFHQQKDKNQ